MKRKIDVKNISYHQIKKIIIFAVIILLLFSVLRISCSSDLNESFTRIRMDYKVYYWSGKAIVNGIPLSEIPKYAEKKGEKNVLPFLYPPTAAIFFIPLTLGSVESGQIIYFSIFIIPCFLIILICSGVLSGKNYMGQILIVLAFFRPIQQTISLGQIHLFTVALISLAYIFLIKEKLKIAGLFAAIVILIKPTDAVLWLLFVLVTRPRALIWTAAATVSLVLFSLPVTGISEWTYWLGKLSEINKFRSILIPWTYTLCFAPVMALAIRGFGDSDSSEDQKDLFRED